MSRHQVETVEDRGERTVLFERDGAYDVEVDGVNILATDRHQANQGLAELALAPWQGRDDITVLLGGLGSGDLLKQILAQPGVVRVDVVEVSAAIIDWERRFFGAVSADPRVRMHRQDLGPFAKIQIPDAPEDGWSILIVDTDEHPTWLSRPGNRSFYSEDGLASLMPTLRGGGVLAMWTTEKDDVFLKAMSRHYQQVTRIGAGGDQGLVYVHRGRRGPRRAS